MKTNIRQLTRLIQEVTSEVLKEYEGNVNEHLSAVVPVRPKENVSEAPSSKPSDEHKQFAKEIENKMKDRMRKAGWADPWGTIEAVRQMVEFKLAKEGWTKSGSESDISTKHRVDVMAAMAPLHGMSSSELKNYSKKMRRPN